MRLYLRVKDGLGNQLFEYAAGLYYARRYRGSMTLIRDPRVKTESVGHPRPLRIDAFRIAAPIRDRNLLDRAVWPSTRPFETTAPLARFVTRTHRHLTHTLETNWTFLKDLPIPPLTHFLYLDGHFQAYQYAAAVEPTLREEFQLREPATGKNLVALLRIQAADEAVSLHVRRGDYAKIDSGRLVLPMQYYANAIRAMQGSCRNPTFFVFSDDIPFCRAHLPAGPTYIFVDHNSEANAQEDLRLMSACRHHIIANSSFSWWGAWLNPRTEKKVLAPDRWFDPSIPHPDALPPTWQRIPSAVSGDTALRPAH